MNPPMMVTVDQFIATFPEYRDVARRVADTIVERSRGSDPRTGAATYPEDTLESFCYVHAVEAHSQRSGRWRYNTPESFRSDCAEFDAARKTSGEPITTRGSVEYWSRIIKPKLSALG